MKTRANEFDSLVGKIQAEKTIELSKGTTLLELGCGTGEFTAVFAKKFKKVVSLDCSQQNIEIAREKIRSKNVYFVVSKAEKLQNNEKFDTIVVNMLLEHVEKPISVLKNAKSLLADNGRIIIQVPNANSFNRQIAQKMGIIENIHCLPKEQVKDFGHKRVYDMNMLIKNVKSAGFKIIKKGGLVFKPLTNEQMQLVIENKNVEWKTKFMQALLEIGKKFPEECAVIYVVAVK